MEKRLFFWPDWGSTTPAATAGLGFKGLNKKNELRSFRETHNF